MSSQTINVLGVEYDLLRSVHGSRVKEHMSMERNVPVWVCHGVIMSRDTGEALACRGSVVISAKTEQTAKSLCRSALGSPVRGDFRVIVDGTNQLAFSDGTIAIINVDKSLIIGRKVK